MQTSPLATQDLLQAVWTRLHFPEAQQIDMAIKYSSQLFVTQLNQVRFMRTFQPGRRDLHGVLKFNTKLELLVLNMLDQTFMYI